MRLPMLVVLVLCTACARSSRPSSVVPPSSVGDPAAFGPGIVDVSRTGLILELTTPAYVGVVRVLPGRSARIAALTGGAFEPGRHSVRLAVERRRLWVPNRDQVRSHSYDEAFEACLARRQQWDASNRQTPAPPPCVRTRRPERIDGGGRWMDGGAVSLPEHYLVVIASEAPIDRTALETLLREIDFPALSGDEAARFIPLSFMQERGRQWAAWIVHQP